MELKQGSSIPETANKARFACFPPSMFIARLTCSTSSSLVGCRCVIRLRVQQLSFLLQKQLHCAAAKRAAKFRNSRRDGVLNGWISGLVHVPVPRGEEFADESNAMQVQVPRLHKTWRAFTFTFPRMFSWYFLLSITSSLFFFFLLFVSVSVLTGFICPALASAGPGCSPFHLMQAPLTVSKRIDTASPAVKGLVQLNELELI